MSSFFTISSLSKTLKKCTILRDINLSIEKGQIWAVLGPSGAGKTTFLRTLAGFEFPEKGRVILSGRDITYLPPHLRPINMVFQSYALFTHLSVEENVFFGLRFEPSIPQKEKTQRVHEILHLLSIFEIRNKAVTELSGGQKQRVALARCLVKRPQLLLLDEPFSALDKILRERVQMEIRAILEHLQLTCICVTHDQQGALALSTHMAIIGNNTIQQTGRTEDVYKYPNTVYTARFLGDINIFSGKIIYIDSSYVTVEASEKWGCSRVIRVQKPKLGAQVCFGVRPEAITLLKAPPVKDYNCIKGVVYRKLSRGKETLYDVACGKGVNVHVIAISTANQDIAEGETVWAAWGEEAAIALQL